MIRFSVRGPVAEDRNFILRTWLDSYRNEGECRRMLDPVYYDIMRPRVLRLLSRSTVIVACDPEYSWQIYGWMCAEPSVLHYAYTKGSFQRLGIATHLFNECGRPHTATHTCRLWPEVRAAWGISYDPRGAS